MRTQKEVAQIMGCSRNRIINDEKRILHKIRIRLLPVLRELRIIAEEPRARNPDEPKGEIPFKTWKAIEASRLNISHNAVQMRVNRGKYPDLKIIRANGPESRALSVRIA